MNSGTCLSCHIWALLWRGQPTSGLLSNSTSSSAQEALQQTSNRALEGQGPVRKQKDRAALSILSGASWGPRQAAFVQTAVVNAVPNLLISCQGLSHHSASAPLCCPIASPNGPGICALHMLENVLTSWPSDP